MLSTIIPGSPERNYYKKDQQHIATGISYWEISPIGDGNCGLYAFILGLIDAITAGRLILGKERFASLREATLSLKNLSQLERIPYHDSLIIPIYHFIQFLDNPDLSFSEFKDFLLAQNTCEQLTTINIVFSQVLREIGFDTYLQTIGLSSVIDNPDIPKEDLALLENGQWVGGEILLSLANYFQVNIRLIAHSVNSNNCFTVPQQATPAPLFSLLNNLDKNHWYYLLPVGQTDGLARFLSSDEPTEIKRKKEHPPQLQRRISQSLLADNQKLIQEIQKESEKNEVSLNGPELSVFAKKLKQIIQYLKEIFEKEAHSSEEYQEALYQACFIAHNSTEILDKIRQSLDHKQLDESLNRLRLLEIEKALIKRPLVIDGFTDTLAVGLQNAEIADFFLRNSEKLPTTLFFSKLVSCRSSSLETISPSPRWLSCS